MSQQEDVRGLCKDIMKNGLLLTERTEELVRNYSGEGVEDEMVDVTRLMLKNTDDADRQLKIIQFSANIGERLGSDKMVRFAQEAGMTWQEKHGDV